MHADDRLARLGRDGRLLPDRRADPRPPGPLPHRHRAADRPGHRGLLPGGAVRAPSARRRPVAGRTRRRRPLRRRPMAHRDGPALPGARARRCRIRGGFGRPGAGQGRGGRADRPDHDPPGSAPRRRARPASTTWPTSSTRSTSSTTPRRSCARPGRPSDPAGGSSSSTGRSRRSGTSSGRGTASSSPASSSTSSTRARRSRPASSSWPGSPRAGCPSPPSSTCRRAPRSSSPSEPDPSRTRTGVGTAKVAPMTEPASILRASARPR